MKLIDSTLATARFEFQRSLTPGRITGFVILGLFPPAITLVVTLTPGAPPPMVAISVTTLVVCLLSNLLWATPVVSNELEGKTWVYSGARPMGRITMLLGKYLVAVLWTSLVCWTAITFATAIATVTYRYGNHLKPWVVMMGLATLASISYAAIFTLLGALFHRRSMMVAMAYCLAAEVAIAQIPAVIGYMTVRSHLTHVIFYSLDPLGNLDDPSLNAVIGEPALFVRTLAIPIIGLVALGAAMGVTRYREYITTDES